MTHDEMIAVIQAHKEGKQIQFKTRYSDEWTDCEGNEPIWDFDDYDYRVKPEPKYRPYASAEECFREVIKHGGWILDEDGVFLKPTEIHDDKLYVTEGLNRVVKWTFADMVEDAVWADDGTPCGVKEED